MKEDDPLEHATVVLMRQRGAALQQHLAVIRALSRKNPK